MKFIFYLAVFLFTNASVKSQEDVSINDLVKWIESSPEHAKVLILQKGFTITTDTGQWYIRGESIAFKRGDTYIRYLSNPKMSNMRLLKYLAAPEKEAERWEQLLIQNRFKKLELKEEGFTDFSFKRKTTSVFFQPLITVGSKNLRPLTLSYSNE